MTEVAGQGAVPQGDRRLRGHMPALDGVRGLAILLVLALHFVANTTPTSATELRVFYVFAFGKFGVDLFFVLSGFLITGILIEAKGRRGYFRTFYMRRTLRIFPLYYGVCAFLFFVAPLIRPLRGPDLELLVREQGWVWAYAVNIYTAIRGAFSLPYIDHLWSLAVEEHFYLFWPLIVWACSRRTLVGVSLGLAIVSMLARTAFAGHMSDVGLYVLTPFRLDALCLGGFFAAYARGEKGLDRLGRALGPMVAGAAAVYFGTYGIDSLAGARLHAPFHEIRCSMIEVLLGALMLSPLTHGSGRTARFFNAPVMRTFGKYSYGLYMFHHFIAAYVVFHGTEFWIAGLVGSHPLAIALQATAGVAVSFAIAWVSYHAFEMRFIALKDALSKPKDTAKPAVEAASTLADG
jgi:peptidoglycan/LPS O-acetylase OafA/YrhL